MEARSDGFQNWDVAPDATLVLAPAISRRAGADLEAEEIPALVPTAT